MKEVTQRVKEVFQNGYVKRRMKALVSIWLVVIMVFGVVPVEMGAIVSSVISHQPTVEEPYVEIEGGDGSETYQWYSCVTESALVPVVETATKEDEIDAYVYTGTYDAGTGCWKNDSLIDIDIPVEEGNIVHVTAAAVDAEENVSAFDGIVYEYAGDNLVKNADGSYTYVVEYDQDFNICVADSDDAKSIVAKISVIKEVYKKNTAIAGQTTDTYTGTPGLVCCDVLVNGIPVQTSAVMEYAYDIMVQPDAEYPVIEVNKPEEVVSYQWYAYEKVTDSRVLAESAGDGLKEVIFNTNSAVYDAGEKTWTDGEEIVLIFESKVNSEIKAEVSVKDSEGNPVSFEGNVMSAIGSNSFEETESGSYEYNITETDLSTGDFAILVEYTGACVGYELSVKVSIDEYDWIKGEAIAGQTSAVYTGDSGYRACAVTFTDGSCVMSDILDIQYYIMELPSELDPSANVSDLGKVQQYQWYKSVEKDVSFMLVDVANDSDETSFEDGTAQPISTNQIGSYIENSNGWWNTSGQAGSGCIEMSLNVEPGDVIDVYGIVKETNKTDFSTSPSDFDSISQSEIVPIGNETVNEETWRQYKYTISAGYASDEYSIRIYYSDGHIWEKIRVLVNGTRISEELVTGATGKTFEPEQIGCYFYKVIYNDGYILRGPEFDVAKLKNTVTITSDISKEYNGDPVSAPTYSATNMAGTPTFEYKVATAEDSTYTTTAPTEAGQYKVRVTVAASGDYKEGSAEADFSITKGAQAVPDVTGVAESIKGKGDGKITGLTTAMEYSTSAVGPYTAVAVADMPFAAGTYYVRYAETVHYAASEPKEVAIGEGHLLKAILPSSQVGYTITADGEFPWNGGTTIHFALANGYSKTNDFAVKVNGSPVTLDQNGAYSFGGAQADATVTVEGIKDITVPTVSMQIVNVNNTTWTQFLNNITFGLFFKESKEVKIDATDDGSGVAGIWYYVADSVKTKAEIEALGASDWQGYNGQFAISPDRKAIVYVKAQDIAGNIVYISSDGMVFDATAPTITGVENGQTYYGDTTFTVADDNLDTVKVDGNEVTLNNGTYTIPADNASHTVVAMDKSGNSTTYTFRVMKIYTVKFIADGTTVAAVNVNHGATLANNQIPAIPVKEGYDQTAPTWDVTDFTFTSDKTINAVYTINKYAVTVVTDAAFTITSEDEATVDYMGNYTFKYQVNDGYTELTGASVKVNGVEVQLTTEGAFTIENISSNQTITVEGVADITAPEAAVKVAGNVWKEFLNTITFGLFFKETQTITVESADEGSGVSGVWYFVTDSALSLEDMDDVNDGLWVRYEGTVNINPDTEAVVYIKAEDKDGNVAYISTDGMIYDFTAPAVEGIEDGKTYNGSVTIKVTDKYLDAVKVDGVIVSSQAVKTESTEGTKNSSATTWLYTIAGDNKKHTVEASDKAGNVTTYEITVNEASAEPTDTPVPTAEPTTAPTVEPTTAPTAEPTTAPTAEPTTAPTTEPTAAPTVEPTTAPTAKPTTAPTAEPTTAPTAEPTTAPTTGDESPVVVWFMAWFLSAAVCTGCVVRGVKKREDV